MTLYVLTVFLAFISCVVWFLFYFNFKGNLSRILGYLAFEMLQFLIAGGGVL